ncbi:hypothetical protein OG211_31435 [Streptomyces niveus]|uniref:hypothetical protein n=1 Tax=Streptomyces niveus TaxID=193462 RepID=UPI00386AB774|nr:hypothetical protein OG211_31435 [Streptomyces niveus]
MSELTGNRIRTTAAKLGLPHLAENINEFTRRAGESSATKTSSTWPSPRNSPSGTTAASARACDSPGCHTTNAG